MLVALHNRTEKPDFKQLEWQLPIEYFPETGLRKSTHTADYKYFIKSFLEMSFASIMVICFIPIYIIIGLLIILTTEGPMFFVQERIGMDGVKFKIFKFRSMYVNADKVQQNILSLNEASGPVFKIRKDPRITKVGGFLRKTGLDELPQLLNIIRGDMSLIGPRPPLESEVRQYEEWQTRRLSVRPGITCTWQIQPKRHSISFEEWVNMDLDYIDNWSLYKDTQLFFKTIKTVFVAGGH